MERVKGIGKKTAERLVLELRDKIGKQSPGMAALNAGTYNTAWNDALDALLALGILRAQADAGIKKIQSSQPDITSVEDIIKLVLKSL